MDRAVVNDTATWSQGPIGQQQRKARQLCRQVGETLEMILSGECADELLQSLCILSVEPAPNCTRLLVTVGTDMMSCQEQYEGILELLESFSGRLRFEVGAAITRKRVPTLLFHVVPLEFYGESIK